MKVKFKILCTSHQACPEVKNILMKLGFSDLNDLSNSRSFDISAKIELKNDSQKEEIVNNIFQKCNEKVETIQVAA